MTAPFPTPSPHARQLVRGAYDLHVHIDPDVIKRRITDLELAERFAELGLAGFVLKSHYVPTAERASVVRAVLPDINVLGSVVLNNAVGGLNPVAVEIAARSGARVVWLPTVDAANEAGEAHPLPSGKLPLWAKLQQEMRNKGLPFQPLGVLDPYGEVLPPVRQILQVIAEYRLVLATGHLSRDEIMAVVKAAVQEGVKHIVVTHPDYPTQDLSIEDQAWLAGQGAWLERCLAPSVSGKVAWERLFEAIRAVGPQHSVLSTDLGQPQNPPVQDGLALFADRLLEAGFSEAEVRTMAVTNTRKLALGEG